MPRDKVFPTWRVIAPDGIRIRSKPSLDGAILSRFAVGSRFDQIGKLVKANGYVWAPHSRGFSAVREVDGIQFAVVSKVESREGGVHLDPRNIDVNGKPPVQALGQILWLRINYDVSFEHGDRDINAAFQLYEPICRPYLEAGKRIIFILSHETFGENTEGQPVVRPQEFANFVATIVNQWRAWNHQLVWEIWNEPDLGFEDEHFDPNGQHASVPLTPSAFANLLGLTIRSIRAVDPNSVLISGGLMAGKPNYLRDTIRLLPEDVRLDGIAIHPYGQDPERDPRFGPHGNLVGLMRAYRMHAQGIPLYITEWGVLNQPSAPVEDVAKYAQRFLAASSELAECAIWFAWADKIHNGYGLVDEHQKKKTPLYEVFAK
jgi:hypothetical protein